MSNTKKDILHFLESEYWMTNAEIENFTDFVKFRFSRSHFVVVDNWKKYFLKLCDKVDIDLIKNEAIISKSFYNNRFVNCPKIIESTKGLPYAEYEDKIAVIYEFIDAKNLGPKILDDWTIEYWVSRKTYAFLAMLHAKLKEINTSIVKRKSLSLEVTLEKIYKILEIIDENILKWKDIDNVKFHKEYLEFVKSEIILNIDKAEKIEQSISKQLIHWDIYWQNILSHEWKPVFIDWETAVEYYRVYDILRSIHFSYSPPTKESQQISIEKIIETITLYHKIERFDDNELKYAMDIYYLDWLTNIQLLWDIYFNNVDYKNSIIYENFWIIKWLKENKDWITIKLLESLNINKS